MNVVFLAIDGLQAAALGCYGNAAAATPAIDRLACESLLCDFTLADAPTLDAAYAAWLCGRHVIEPSAVGESWLRHGPFGGSQAVLFSDVAGPANVSWSAHFAEVICIPPSEQDRPAEELEDTVLAGLAATAGEWLARQRDPFCAWLHVGSLTERWDAPLELRERLRDEEDPPVYAGIAPPSAILRDPESADERWSLAQAYAAQVSVVDWFIGEVLEAVQSSPVADETLLVLTSPRGFPLGEHGRVGLTDAAPYAELIHVPLLIRFPQGEGRLMRTGRFVQPCDLAATLGGWDCLAGDRPKRFARSLRPLARSEREPWREAAVVQHGPWKGLRTPSWYLLQQSEGTALGEPQLFAKPDDRRELNEIANRCPDVCSVMQAELNRRLAAGQSADFSDLPPLPRILTAPH